MASNPIPISEWDFFNMIMNVVTHDIIVVEVTVAEKTLNYDETLRAHGWLYYLVRDFYKNIAETFSKKANVEVDLFEAENSLLKSVLLLLLVAGNLLRCVMKRSRKITMRLKHFSRSSRRNWTGLVGI